MSYILREEIEIYKEENGKETVLEVYSVEICNREDCNCVGSWNYQENPNLEEMRDAILEEGATLLRTEVYEDCKLIKQDANA